MQLGIDYLLYAATLISLSAYIIQFMTGTMTFASGLVFLPAGAVLGYLYFRNPQGACLGIHIVFLIRHIVRDIILRLIFMFIRMISGN